MVWETVKYRIGGAGRNGRDLLTHDINKAREQSLQGRPVATALFREWGRSRMNPTSYKRLTDWEFVTWQDRQHIRYHLLDGKHLTFQAEAARKAYEQGRLVVTTDAIVTKDGFVDGKSRFDQKKPEPAKVYSEDLAL
jgi:hypothetical protein